MGAVFSVGAALFFFLCVDIVDGRDNHMDMSPYFHANTDTAALAACALMEFLCVVALLFIIGGSLLLKSDKDGN